MATPAELRSLEPALSSTTGSAVPDGANRDEGVRLGILANLDSLVRLRLQALLAEVGITARSLQGTKPLAANSIIDRVRELNDARKSARPPVPIFKCDEAELRSDFTSWRQKHETARVASAARPLSRPGKPQIVDAAQVAPVAEAATAPALVKGMLKAPLVATAVTESLSARAVAAPKPTEDALQSAAGAKRRRMGGPQSLVSHDDAEPAAAGSLAPSGNFLGTPPASSSGAMISSWVSQSK